MELCHHKNDHDDISKRKKRKKAVLGLRAYPARFMMMSAIMLNMWCLPSAYCSYKPVMIRCWPIFGTLLPRYKYRRKSNFSVNNQKDQQLAKDHQYGKQDHQYGKQDRHSAKDQHLAKDHQYGNPKDHQYGKQDRNSAKDQHLAKDHQYGNPKDHQYGNLKVHQYGKQDRNSAKEQQLCKRRAFVDDNQ